MKGLIKGGDVFTHKPHVNKSIEHIIYTLYNIIFKKTFNSKLVHDDLRVTKYSDPTYF